MLTELKILIYGLLNDGRNNPTARLYPQTDNIKGVYTFGVRRYNANENRLDIEVFCNDSSPEGTDGLADTAIELLKNAGFYLTGIRDSSDTQKGIYRQDLSFAYLTHNGYDRIKIGYKTSSGSGTTFINGIMNMSITPGKKEIIRMNGRYDAGDSVTETIRKRRDNDGYIRIKGKADMSDSGQNLIRNNYQAETPFWIEIGDGLMTKKAKAIVKEINPTIESFDAGIQLLGGFV